MKALALFAMMLASLTTAPLAALALDAPSEGASEPAIPEALASTARTTAAANAGLVFTVRHTGMDAPAILMLEGDSTVFARAVVLSPGANTLIDDAFPVGTYRITLQNVMTTGSNSVDLAACEHGVHASMNTTFSPTRFALSIPPDQCLAGEA